MALKCDVCDKKTAHGNQHLHRHSAWRFRAPKTKRIWAPNIRNLAIPGQETSKTIHICMSCYKRYQKDGVPFLVRRNVKGIRAIKA